MVVAVVTGDEDDGGDADAGDLTTSSISMICRLTLLTAMMTVTEVWTLLLKMMRLLDSIVQRQR